MPGKTEQHRQELLKRRDRERYLTQHSGLPGPRANLELVEAAGDIATLEEIWRWSESDDEFVALCGTAGLGRFALSDPRVLPRLKALAADSRWRIREGVAIALQRLGKQDMPRLIKEMRRWATGSRYVQRAAAAAVCEPPLLKDPRVAEETLDIVDVITRSLAASKDRSAEDFRVLRQALGYCWSVAAAAAPSPAKTVLEKWLRSSDPDVRWIMRSNLGKARMAALGDDWLQRMRSKATEK